MSFAAALRTRPFTVSAELTPISDANALVKQARALLQAVDAIQVSDNPTGRAQVAALAAAAVLRQAGIDPVLHMSCRDRNRVALRSDLLGAATLGVTSLLVMRSGPLRVGARPASKPVAEMGATQLIAAARALRENETPTALGMARAPDFFIGAMMTVFDAPRGWQPRAPTAKVDAGAQFLQSQLCFDTQVLRRYMKHLVDTRLVHRCHVMVSIAAPATAESARWMRDNLRGALVPDVFVRRLRQASDPERVSVEICAEVLRELATVPGVSGAHFLAPVSPAIAAAIVEASGVRTLRPTADSQSG